MGFLAGKRILITGLLSNRSIAYGIAKAMHREGAELAFTYQNDRFKDRVFTEREQKKAEGRPHAIAATYAKRWAAKEACSKALGTGLRMGISWRDMAVTNLPSGQPVMHVTGWAAERLRAMTPPGHEAVIHVTLTDDHPWAQAFVVIEARPIAVPGTHET